VNPLRPNAAFVVPSPADLATVQHPSGADRAPRRGSRIEIRTIAVGRHPRPGAEELFLDYGRFRGWMYVINEITTSASLHSDGTDFDRYDDHAVHLAAVETVWSDDGVEEQVVGATRLILDIGRDDHPYARAGLRPGLGRLPVEQHFPEMAEAIDLRDDRVRIEVSRYAATHRRPALQRRTTLALREGIAAHFVNAGGEGAYAVLEEPLATRLGRDGVRLKRLTEPRLLPEYGSVNFGVWIDLRRLADELDCAITGRSPLDVTIGVHDAVGR